MRHAARALEVFVLLVATHPVITFQTFAAEGQDPVGPPVTEAEKKRVTPTLANGGFGKRDERGRPVGWYGMFRDPQVDTKVYRSAPSSLRIETKRLGTEEVLSGFVPVEAGQEIEASLWARVGQAKGVASLACLVRWYLLPTERASCGATPLALVSAKDGAFDWREFKRTCTVPPKVTYARVHLKNDRASVLLWIDDVVLKKAADGRDGDTKGTQK